MNNPADVLDKKPTSPWRRLLEGSRVFARLADPGINIQSSVPVRVNKMHGRLRRQFDLVLRRRSLSWGETRFQNDRTMKAILGWASTTQD